MLETPINVHPSNGEVVDYSKENSKFTFQFKGDKISYIYGQMYYLSNDKERISWICGHNTDDNSGYNNEIVESHPLDGVKNSSGQTVKKFTEIDYGKDFKYNYTIFQKHLDIPKEFYGKVENIDVTTNPEFIVTHLILSDMPTQYFDCIKDYTIEFYTADKILCDNSISRLSFNCFSKTEKYIMPNGIIKSDGSVDKTNIKNSVYQAFLHSIDGTPVYYKITLNPNAPKADMYFGRNEAEASNIAYLGTKNIMINHGISNFHKPFYSSSGAFLGGMYIQIGEEKRLITDCVAKYIEAGDHTNYYISLDSPFPTKVISENKNDNYNAVPFKIVTNYIVTPWYDFKHRKKPECEISVTRKENGLLCSGIYSQEDGVSLKSYQYKIYPESNEVDTITTPIHQTGKEYSYRLKVEFPVPTVTANYRVECEVTTQENDSVSSSASYNGEPLYPDDFIVDYVTDIDCLPTLNKSGTDWCSHIKKSLTGSKALVIENGDIYILSEWTDDKGIVYSEWKSSFKKLEEEGAVYWLA